MSRATLGLPDELQAYLVDRSVRESDVQRRLREETAAHPRSHMQIAPEQAQFMSVLVRISGARSALEVGVFTGYSALAVAAALPPDGRLVACELNEEYTETARGYWKEAGVDHKIALRLGPALETLDQLLDDGHRAAFDFAFIDADKETYPEYYERTLALLRPGGVIVIDNIFSGGRVVDPSLDTPALRAIRRLNDLIAHDERVDACILPIADGVTVARKR